MLCHRRRSITLQLDLPESCQPGYSGERPTSVPLSACLAAVTKSELMGDGNKWWAPTACVPFTEGLGRAAPTPACHAALAALRRAGRRPGGAAMPSGVPVARVHERGCTAKGCSAPAACLSIFRGRSLAPPGHRTAKLCWHLCRCVPRSHARVGACPCRRCGGCKEQLVFAVRKLDVHTLPETLVIQIKRFAHPG